MDVKDRLVRLQKFMIMGYEARKRQLGVWHLPVAEFANWMGTSSASTDHWLRGTRMPDLANTIRISQYLGPEIFDITGFDRHIVLTDQRLAFIVDTWEILDDAAKQRILELFDEFGGKRPE